MTAIDEKFADLMMGGLNLGAPLGAEEPTYDGGSMRRHSFGNLYFHPRLGSACELHGAILVDYVARFETMSELGYPITDELPDPDVPGGRISYFEHGRLMWSAATGVTFAARPGLGVAPQIVVKVQDSIAVGIPFRSVMGLNEFAALGGPAGALVAAALGPLLPGLTLHRLWLESEPADIANLVALATSEDPAYAPPRFENFLEIDCPAGFDPGSLLAVLQGFAAVVEYAYVVGAFSDPVTPNDDPKFNTQGYLAAAPGGINAPAAWARGADGTGKKFIDVEQGWFLPHEDLPAGIRLLTRQNSALSFGHGCAVLGEIVGVDNTRGIVGAAPGASAALVSYFHPDNVSSPLDSPAVRQRVHDAIMFAGPRLAPNRRPDGSHGDGGVLLIEAQTSARFNAITREAPVEVDPAIFHVIRLLTLARVIVVECAGNGDVNLDDYRDRNGLQTLRRGTPDFKDSGAIMVTGSMAAVPHRKVDTATSKPKTRINFGSRIDCYAWGEQIVTTGWKQSTPTAANVYHEASTSFFGGSSGAAPIIAGTCLLMQGLQEQLTPRAHSPGSLTPREMRRILSLPANGTGSMDPIGVMPDFAKLIPNEFM